MNSNAVVWYQTSFFSSEAILTFGNVGWDWVFDESFLDWFRERWGKCSEAT